MSRRRTTRSRAATMVAGVTAALAASVLSAPAASADRLDDGQWWRTAMGVDELAAAGATGKGITVAVIDGPINPDVPELKGRVASTTTSCFSPQGEKEKSTGVGAEASHATSMAALIVGSGKGTASGGRGITGIAPEATLRHYAALYRDQSNPDGGLTCAASAEVGTNISDEAVARAIEQAAADGAKVISVSLAVGYDESFVPALLAAYKAGAIVVSSSDNRTGRVAWPAAGNGVVTVSPVGPDRKLPSFAPKDNALVDFAAPGVQIASGILESGKWQSDVLRDGSSQATAITAGGLAAVWSAHPTATANQVLSAAREAIGMRQQDGKYVTDFRRVGGDLPRATGKTTSYGFGIFAPADAVKLDVASLPNVSPMVATTGVGNEPTAEQIAAATGTPVSESPTPTDASSPSKTRPTVERPGDAADRDDGTAIPWLVAGALALLVAGGALALWTRGRGRSNSTRIPDTTEHNDSAAAEGAANTTTKEHIR
ncbi:subtilase family protein [Knoellia remsis]|uniref:Subtilase family protein n=1 Tax=Knoellia remsis TaxID=407159 RepID=A0A2T0UED5_9MICO|nr:S8 family serine peptidase [Knoellia remsis]PRY56306.1 subtilase family protein [Knoellia remsis]